MFYFFAGYSHVGRSKCLGPVCAAYRLDFLLVQIYLLKVLVLRLHRGAVVGAAVEC